MLQKALRKLFWPLLMPSLLLYLVVGLWPNLSALYWALTSYDGLSPVRRFIGLQNFGYMIRDDRWWRAVGNTIYFGAGTVVTLLPLGLLFAVLLMNVRRGQGFFKTMVYLPSVLPLVVVAFLFVFILDPTIGLLNEILKKLELFEPLKGVLGVNRLHWLGQARLAKPTVVMIQLWQALGFYTLLFMAGLSKLPPELFDAAAVDGANGWQRFRRITWPLLFPTTQTILLLLIINGLQVFTLIYALSGSTGSDSGVPSALQVMATYVYRTAFRSRRFGYATALSTFLMVVVLAFTLATRELTRRETVQY